MAKIEINETLEDDHKWITEYRYPTKNSNKKRKYVKCAYPGCDHQIAAYHFPGDKLKIAK